MFAVVAEIRFPDPFTSVQVPSPLPARRTESLQTVLSSPACASGNGLTVIIISSNLLGQGALETVHRRTRSPIFNPVTALVGLAGSETFPFPLTTVQSPFPLVIRVADKLVAV